MIPNFAFWKIITVTVKYTLLPYQNTGLRQCGNMMMGWAGSAVLYFSLWERQKVPPWCIRKKWEINESQKFAVQPVFVRRFVSHQVTSWFMKDGNNTTWVSQIFLLRKAKFSIEPPMGKKLWCNIIMLVQIFFSLSAMSRTVRLSVVDFTGNERSRFYWRQIT